MFESLLGGNLLERFGVPSAPLLRVGRSASDCRDSAHYRRQTDFPFLIRPGFPNPDWEVGAADRHSTRSVRRASGFPLISIPRTAANGPPVVTRVYTNSVRWYGRCRARPSTRLRTDEWHGEVRNGATVGCPDDWTFHAPGKGIHSSSESTPRTAAGRRAYDPAFPAQSAIQPKAIVVRPTFRPPSLPVHARSGWVQACIPGFHQYRLDQRELPWLRRLYADAGVSKTSGGLGDACDVGADCNHVCRSRSMALSSLPDIGCIVGAGN